MEQKNQNEKRWGQSMKQIKDLILETKKIKWVDILDLQPIDLKNDYHSEKTKQSIIENGFSRAIYVWLNPEDQQTYIIDGHLRTDLLKELVNDGYDVPDRLNCTFLDLPNKQTAIKYLLQVFNQKTNPISQKALGDWFDELDLSIPELNLQIDDLHIELDDIPPLIETQGDDDVTESAPPITRRGDVYELGGVHRVMCGDSTSIDDVERLMDGEKADMVFTDPPYGIKMAKGFEGFGGFGKPIKRRQYENDKWDDKRPDHNCFELIMKYGENSIIFGGNFFADILPQSKHWLVWDKNNTMPTASEPGVL